MNRASRASSIRLRGLAVSAGLLFTVATSGFASADTGINGVEEAIRRTQQVGLAGRLASLGREIPKDEQNLSRH